MEKTIKITTEELVLIEYCIEDAQILYGDLWEEQIETLKALKEELLKRFTEAE